MDRVKTRSGLIHRDPLTERITRNVLRRFLKETRRS